jgi:hypothetical protein
MPGGRFIYSAIGCAAIAIGLLLPPVTQAYTPIVTFKAYPSVTQAGGHPDIFTGWTNGSHETQASPCDCSDAKNFIFNNPPGVIGNPHAAPQCTEVEFASHACPVDSQIGVADAGGPFKLGLVPIFNLEPTPGNAGLLGFIIPIAEVPFYEIINPRTESDYGLKFSAIGIPLHNFTPTTEFAQRIWGVPASTTHDALRFPYKQVDSIGCQGTKENESVEEEVNWTELRECGFPGYSGSIHSSSPAAPFVSNPTTCGVTLSAALEVDSYDGGSASAAVSWPPTTGCDQLSFNPSLFAQPTTTATDTPSGIDVDLRVPEQVSPSVPSPSEIRSALITLPPGFTINPGAADGKTACTEVEAHFGTEEEAKCPESSKVGSLSIESSALPGPLPGYVYLGQPLPGNRYRIFLTANGFGVHVKLAGTVIPDPATGQLKVSFTELPQSPFSDFNMHFFGSERGLLATPTRCGIYPVTSTFTPWDSLLSEQTSTQYFSLGSGPSGAPCPSGRRPFSPTFSAVSTNRGAGAHSPFILNLTRSDRDQNLSSLTVSTPPGFSATLRGVPYCPDAAISAAASSAYSGLAEQGHSSCPPTSQIGFAVAGAGAGAHPLYVSGKVYLAGPYGGAPLSLVIITPAVSGPYDLGNVVVRAALHVDPATAQVFVVSDPIPQLVEGVPLRLRSIQVDLDRSGFTLNPTNCEPLSVSAQAFGDETTVAGLAQHFQVANCASLPFAPKLSLKLTGGVHRRGHPAIHAVVTTQPGEANPSSISVTLPSNELLDNAHIRTVCTKLDFAKEACPNGSLLGHVSVATPLLDRPLQGGAYLRSSGQGLPDLALDLHGQLHIEAVARIDAVNAGLRTTFQTVPDVPLGTVKLNLLGGSKGLIQNSETLCGIHQAAAVTMAGQNGARLRRKVHLHPACGQQSRRGGRR